MPWQSVIVIAIVILAAVFIARQAYRSLTGRGGCAQCSVKSSGSGQAGGNGPIIHELVPLNVKVGRSGTGRENTQAESAYRRQTDPQS